MSSYATLLDECAQEEMYANETFSSLGSYLESVTNFVNEDVNFEVTISLDEAVSGDIKDKAGKIGASVKKAIDSLIAKLQEFITKIGEAVKRFVSKAKVTITQKGNVAMKKLLNDSTAKLKKEVKLKEISYNGKSAKSCVDDIFNKAAKAASTVYGNIDKIADKLETFEDPSDVTRVTAEIEALSEDITKSSVVKEATVPAASTVSAAYKLYVDQYFVSIEGNLSGVQEICKKAQDHAKALIKSLNKAKSADGKMTAEGSALKTMDVKAITVAKDHASDAMKISTYTVNFAATVLTMATKNSAKIALAAGGNAVKEAPDKAKDAGKKAANAVKNAPAKAKEAADDAKVQAALAKAEVKDKLKK